MIRTRPHDNQRVHRLLSDALADGEAVNGPYRTNQAIQNVPRTHATQPQKTHTAAVKHYFLLRLRLWEVPIQPARRLDITPTAVQRTLLGAHLNRPSQAGVTRKDCGARPPEFLHPHPKHLRERRC